MGRECVRVHVCLWVQAGSVGPDEVHVFVYMYVCTVYIHVWMVTTCVCLQAEFAHQEAMLFLSYQPRGNPVYQQQGRGDQLVQRTLLFSLSLSFSGASITQ